MVRVVRAQNQIRRRREVPTCFVLPIEQLDGDALPQIIAPDVVSQKREVVLRVREHDARLQAFSSEEARDARARAELQDAELALWC